MAAFLHRLGCAAFRRRRYVVLVWLALLGAVVFASSSAESSEDAGTADIEAQQAFALIQQRFPGNPEGATARVVFVAPGGERVTGYRAAIDRLVGEAAQGSQVAAAVSPFRSQAVSADETTAYATVTYTAAAEELTDATRQQLRAAVDEARAAGLTVEVGGPVLASQPSVGGITEVVGVALAALVLLVTFGSLVAAGLPLVTAVLGVGISVLGIVALGFPSDSGTLATMLGLAVGIDYALFVVSRYREERTLGHAPQEAVGLAVSTAGAAVVFAGLTVVIALAGLSVIGIPAAGTMGLAAAGAVVVAVLIALTLVPALLGFWPNAVLGRRRKTTVDGAGARWSRFVQRRPVLVLVASAASLVVLAVPVTQLQLGMPGDEAKSTATSERRAYDALAAGFGPGFNGPLTIVVDARDATDRQAAVRRVTGTIAGTPGVVSVSPAQFNTAGDTALFTATPATAPTSEDTEDLVRLIRDQRGGETFLVTGATALEIDLAAQVQRALVPYLAVVLCLAFLLLLVVFRSLLVPLKAVVGFLLSVLASLGAVVAVFQWGWGAGLIGLQHTGPVISMMPIVLVGIVFGLAMDYEVFLVSRIREAHVRGEAARDAVATGFRRSARVVAAAALIMVAVFAGFAGAAETLVKMMGFGLATAVLLDAFVVRMALVPAVLVLLGERAWSLPRWLDRRLPVADHEPMRTT